MKRKKSFKEWLDEKKQWCEKHEEEIVGTIGLIIIAGGAAVLGAKAGYYKGSSDAAKIAKAGLELYNDGITESFEKLIAEKIVKEDK